MSTLANTDGISITVNDEPKMVPAGETVGTLIERLAVKPQGIAVALNAEVIPRVRWGEQPLRSNDSVLIITATQGG